MNSYVRSSASDPDRAIRTRLRDSLKDYGRPVRWFLIIVEQPAYRHLRLHSDERAPQRAQRKLRAMEAALENAGIVRSHLERIEGDILLKMQQSEKIELLDILKGLLPDHTIDELYVLAGDLAEWLVHRGIPLRLRDMAWYPLGKGIEIQNLTVRRRTLDGKK